MYLTDLSFIEEGSPNTTDEGLVNFSKMRMVRQVWNKISSYTIIIKMKFVSVDERLRLAAGH